MKSTLTLHSAPPPPSAPTAERPALLYLDNAATTWPKPPEVGEAMMHALRDCGGNPGRSGHALSLAAAELIFHCREEAASFFGCSRPERVVFTQNATYALNLAIKTMIPDGSHVLISDMEHNSVLRPVASLAQRRVRYSTFPTGDGDPCAILRALRERLRPNTRAIVTIHGSNICGLRLPLAEIGQFCRRYGLLFLVDASQTAGLLPISMEELGIDALCTAGHKGLYGPPGSGLLLLSERGETCVRRAHTWVEGGSGSASRRITMPEDLPERLEAGTLATPAIAGLLAGLRFVRSRGPETIFRQEDSLRIAALREIRTIPGVIFYRPNDPGGLLLLNLRGYSSEEVGRLLDRQGICVRAGLHCAPGAHRVLGTGEGGAVRISFGAFNRPEDVSRLSAALRRISETPPETP